MSGRVIHLWGGPYEARMRLPHEPAPFALPITAAIIVLPFDVTYVSRLQRRRVTKLLAAEATLLSKVDALLADRAALKAQLDAVSAQLAAAIAANDPAAMQAAQDALNQVAADLDAESVKIDAVGSAPPAA